jgi:phosphoglycolate phosphatase
MDDFRHLVGEGIPKLAERALGATHPWLVARLAELTRARYRVQPCVHTRPYAGIVELVAALRERGIPMGVVSNKSHELTVPIVRRFWPGGEFRFVQGYDYEERRKPSPFHLLRFCEAVGQPPERVWLVGDTPTDIETARRAGATCIAVTWGFRPLEELLAAGARHVVNSPQEIHHLVLSPPC